MDRGRRIVQRLTHPAAAAGAVAVLLVCLLVRDPWFRETLRYTLLGCAVDVLIVAVLFGSRFHAVQYVLNTAILVWIGRLSYSLYIWHEGVSSFLPVADRPFWQALTANLVGTAVVAAISYYAVEQPFLRLRRYLRPHQSALVLRPRHQQLSIKVGT